MLDEKMQGDQGQPTCYTLPGLSPGQIRLCQLYMDHMNAVAIGARQALSECKYQFQNRRWNCSLVNDVNLFGPVTSMGKCSCCVCHLRKICILQQVANLLSFMPSHRLGWHTQFQEPAKTDNSCPAGAVNWDDQKIYEKIGFGEDVEIIWSMATSKTIIYIKLIFFCSFVHSLIRYGQSTLYNKKCHDHPRRSVIRKLYRICNPPVVHGISNTNLMYYNLGTWMIMVLQCSEATQILL